MNAAIPASEANWWAQTVPLIIPYVLGFVSAVLAEPVRQYFFKASLKLEFSGQEDCLSRTPIDDGSGAVYVRIRVTNSRHRVARSCRAFLTKVEVMNTNKEFEKTIFADSLPLAWSCQPNGKERDALDVLNGVFQYIDVVTASEHSKFLNPQISPFPYRYCPIFQSEPRTYRFTIQVSGDGVDPRTMKLVLAWKGKWDTLDVYENP